LRLLAALRYAGGDMLELLRKDQVQKDLRLTEEQKSRLKKAADQTLSDLRRQSVTWASMSPEDRRKKIAEFREQTRTRLHEALTPAQVERLRQIRLQWDQATALADSDVADALQLSEEQRARIRGVLGRMRQRLREALRTRPDAKQLSPEEAQSRLRELQQEAVQDALGLLTPRQRENLEKMKGKPLQWEESKPSVAEQGSPAGAPVKPK